MATTLQSVWSYLKRYIPGTTGTPAVPDLGDSNWQDSVNPVLEVFENFVALGAGQIPYGQDGAAAHANPTVAPTLSASTGGSLAAGTYTVGYTWTNTYGETTISPTTDIIFASGTTNRIAVTAITPLPTGITGVNWYAVKDGITLKKKIANIGAAFNIDTMPSGGAATPPGTNTTASANHAEKRTLTAGTNVTIIDDGTNLTLASSASNTDAESVNGVISTGSAPVSEQVWTATDGTHASWQDLPGLAGQDLSGGTILVGNVSGQSAERTVSGDGTLSNIGVFTLASTAVSPGSYTGADITVDAKGRITAAANGSGGTPADATSSVKGILKLTGDLAGTASSPALAATAVTAGSYTSANITVDAKGRITAASNGGGGGGGGISSGSGSFPGGPSTGDLFFRTDRDILYFYDGTRWLSVTLYKHQLIFSIGAVEPVTTSGAIPIRAGAMESDYSIYLEKAVAPFGQDANFDASNYWNIKLFSLGASGGSPAQLGSTQSTWAGGRTAGPRYKTVIAVGSVLTTSDQGLFWIEITTGSGSPGNYYPDPGFINYRLVG